MAANSNPIPTDVLEQNSADPWFAAYTVPRHEKIVEQQLAQKNVRSYLPLYEAIHRWKDRKARVQLPLFPGYVFVQVAISDRIRVLEISSVVRIVSFNKQAAIIPSAEIEALRNAIAQRRAEPYPYLVAGKKVRVTSGALQGLEGTVLRRKGAIRIVVTLESIMRSVALELDASDLENCC